MPVAETRLYGKVRPDERLLQSQVAQFPGRIEKLYVNFTGEAIRRGQPLALLYSPDWVTAQQELLEAAKNKSAQPAIYEAAKEKLRNWKIPESRIDAIENTGKVENDIEITANTTGVVTARNINSGDFVSQGQVLFEVADLSRVWVLLDAYESDLPFVTPGDPVVFQVQALPGKSYTGRILFIDPVLDPVTRVAKVRVEMSNPSGELKPEMFVTGLVKARLNQYGNLPVIPRSAVLWTGARSVVYVKQPDAAEPAFRLREVVLGPLLGDRYVVEKGLTEGEEVVTSGAFMVDASAQLEGKPSMMNREDSMIRVP